MRPGANCPRKKARTSLGAPRVAPPGRGHRSRSRQALSALAYGKQARVAVQTIDQYVRPVGRVSVGSTDVNAALVQQGAAWVYRQYARDPQLIDLERQAKAARRSL